MSKTLRSICMGLGLAFLAGMALTGCREPGPAEEAGREIDDTVEEARDAFEDLGDNIEERLEDNDGPPGTVRY
ncbi:MAG: hypothetical protein ACXIUM_06035 [Wenzhouxiangella sp.]